MFREPLLPWMVFLPLAGAFTVLFSPLRETGLRRLALLFSGVTAVLGAVAFAAFSPELSGFQFRFEQDWFTLPGLDAPLRLALGLDGLSVLLLALSAFLMPLILVSAPGHIRHRVREFLFWALLMEAGMIGVFAATDLVLFYFFWELSLIPLYFLVGIWGGPNRIYASLKFVLYTLAGSLVLLVGLIRVALEAGTTDIGRLIEADLDPGLQRFAFACFALGFLIKVPVLPFHTWLPDAHVQAPTGGSVVLAGVMLKMGTYGLMRFGLQAFPAGAVDWAPWLLLLGAAGIVYGSLLAWAQSDIKKLVAYSSVGHLGFVVLGTFAGNATALQGAVLQGVNHGISTGALFLLVGVLYDRRHTRAMDAFGGLARTFPAFAFLLVLTSLASVGLPGTNGFVGEFLILMGTFEQHPWLAALAGLGVVLGAVYMLGLCREVLFGPVTHEANRRLEPLRPREWAALAPLAALMLWIGLYPSPFLERTRFACFETAERLAPWLERAGEEARPPAPALPATPEPELR